LASRKNVTRQLLGLEADPDETPENSYAAVRTIFARDDFTVARKAHKAFVETRGERGTHINLTHSYFLDHQVDGSEDILYASVASVWQLLTIARQINSGWGLCFHCDASFNVCRANVSMITIGCNVLGGHYRNLVVGLMGGGKETTQGYTVTYNNLTSTFFKLTKLPICHDPQCETCKVIQLTLNHSNMQKFLETEKARLKELDVLLLTGDSGKSVDGLARHLDVDHFKCSNHLTGKTLFSAS
jgi:hypothetical protein